MKKHIPWLSIVIMILATSFAILAVLFVINYDYFIQIGYVSQEKFYLSPIDNKYHENVSGNGSATLTILIFVSLLSYIAASCIYIFRYELNPSLLEIEKQTISIKNRELDLKEKELENELELKQMQLKHEQKILNQTFNSEKRT